MGPSEKHTGECQQNGNNFKQTEMWVLSLKNNLKQGLQRKYCFNAMKMHPLVLITI